MNEILFWVLFWYNRFNIQVFKRNVIFFSPFLLCFVRNVNFNGLLVFLLIFFLYVSVTVVKKSFILFLLCSFIKRYFVSLPSIKVCTYHKQCSIFSCDIHYIDTSVYNVLYSRFSVRCIKKTLKLKRICAQSVVI